MLFVFAPLQALGIAGINEVLYLVNGVAEVRAVPEHGAGLRLVPVPPGVHHHLARDSGRRSRTVPHSDEMQSQVDSARDARRRHHPVVHDIQHVTHHACFRVATRKLVLYVVVRRAAPAML